jgi:hypothetical protein
LLFHVSGTPFFSFLTCKFQPFERLPFFISSCASTAGQILPKTGFTTRPVGPSRSCTKHRGSRNLESERMALGAGIFRRLMAVMTLIAGDLPEMGIMGIVGLDGARLLGQLIGGAVALQTDLRGNGRLGRAFPMAGRAIEPLGLVSVREERPLSLGPQLPLSFAQEAGRQDQRQDDHPQKELLPKTRFHESLYLLAQDDLSISQAARERKAFLLKPIP